METGTPNDTVVAAQQEENKVLVIDDRVDRKGNFLCSKMKEAWEEMLRVSTEHLQS
ncbi:MAG: hypothetical protein ACYCZZ_01105 [Minisyncoccota bacterium]